MNIQLEMPILYKMIKHVSQIEDFAHYDILEKYEVDIEISEQDGKLQIKPRVINKRRVHRAHNLKLDCMDEPF